MRRRFIAGLIVLLPIAVLADTHYVDPRSSTPTPPFTNWHTAAWDIQTAISSAMTGDVVLVTNGVYETGGAAVYGLMNNRVALTNSVTVRSVDGPAWTTIKGTTPVGALAVRCAYVGAASVLDGFTLANGATLASGDADNEQSGGGIWCMPGGLVSNCWIEGCTANENGGGVYAGTLVKCRLTGNSAILGGSGGGAYTATLKDCTLSGNHAYRGGGAFAGSLSGCTIACNTSDWLGGGVSDGTLDRCMVVSNSAFGDGGGTYNTALYSCMIVSNVAGNSGGGAAYGTLHNCTISGNAAGVNAGGTYVCPQTNCIVYFNSAPVNANYKWGSFSYSCTAPLPPGLGNITGDPKFVNTNRWSNMRLTLKSICVNTGTNLDWMAGAEDLEGSRRIVNSIVDMGAYEFPVDGCLILVR